MEELPLFNVIIRTAVMTRLIPKSPTANFSQTPVNTAFDTRVIFAARSTPGENAKN